ncbi:hypothetical protein BDC45DRAFT_77101 [Circinella umbellata]|nr:hypothetical protein BDC45DRAFT_77101 [Circinella umbellata]
MNLFQIPCFSLITSFATWPKVFHIIMLLSFIVLSTIVFCRHIKCILRHFIITIFLLALLLVDFLYIRTHYTLHNLFCTNFYLLRHTFKFFNIKRFDFHVEQMYCPFISNANRIMA